MYSVDNGSENNSNRIKQLSLAIFFPIRTALRNNVFIRQDTLLSFWLKTFPIWMTILDNFEGRTMQSTRIEFAPLSSEKLSINTWTKGIMMIIIIYVTHFLIHATGIITCNSRLGSRRPVWKSLAEWTHHRVCEMIALQCEKLERMDEWILILYIYTAKWTNGSHTKRLFSACCLFAEWKFPVWYVPQIPNTLHTPSMPYIWINIMSVLLIVQKLIYRSEWSVIMDWSMCVGVSGDK